MNRTARWSVAFREALSEIRVHWLRSVLTMVGVIMSVAALVSMIALSAGIIRGLREFNKQTGVATKTTIRNGDSWMTGTVKGQFSQGLTYADAEVVRRGAPILTWVSPVIVYDQERIYRGARQGNARMLAGTPAVAIMDRYSVLVGRFLTEMDLDRRARVCVLGAETASKLFADPLAEAVGADVIIRGMSFRVVGLLPRYLSESEERRRAQGLIALQDKRRRDNRTTRGKWDAFSWKNSVAIIPITTALATINSTKIGPDGKDLGPVINISEMQCGFEDPAFMPVAAAQIRRALLKARNGVEDFEVSTADSRVSDTERQIRSNRVTGWLIAGISLIVGALGIVNIMLASITDRMREIGVRRALGASEMDIFRQVLVESAILSIAGGIAGVVVSLVLLRGLEIFSPPTNAPVISWWTAVVGVAAASAVGVIAGLYPALRASRLRPIEALTAE